MKTFLITPAKPSGYTAKEVPATTKVWGNARLFTGDTAPTADQMAAFFAPDFKAAARNKAKAARTALLAAGFSYGGKVIQTRNDTDIANINSAALRAVNDSAFSTVWICADNSYLPLDHAGIIAMQSAMVSRGNAVFAAYTSLVSQIEACTTEAQVNALPALTL